MLKPLTRRQAITRREYRPGHVTQAELGIEQGIKQPAVSMRLKRAREARGEATRRPKAWKRIRRRPLSLTDFTF